MSERETSSAGSAGDGSAGDGSAGDSAADPGSSMPRGGTGPAVWLSDHGPDADVVMSSRVRLARNLAGFPFVNRASRLDRQQVVQIARTKLLEADLSPEMAWLDLREAGPLDRMVLVERQLISSQHSKGKHGGGSGNSRGGPDEPRGVAIGLPDESLSVMVNEEDHLRIQVLRPGLDLSAALARADAADDALERAIDFAFHPRFGYLTACPTNVGTGIRFGVMLHLPALKLTGDIDKVKRAADDMGLAVRGFYGEGSEAFADLYQLSNQTTLGKSESVLLHEMAEEIVPKLIAYERYARETLLKTRREGIEDLTYRALGTLLHARLLPTGEAMDLLSKLRLGRVLGLIDAPGRASIHHLLLLCQPAHLQRTVRTELPQSERRQARAAVIRTMLRRELGLPVEETPWPSES